MCWMMSDICNSILGQAKNGIELHNWFSSSSKTRLILQWRVFPLSFCVCKVPNFPIPKNLQLFCELLSNPKLPISFELLLRVTPWHARPAHYVPYSFIRFWATFASSGLSKPQALQRRLSELPRMEVCEPQHWLQP